MSKFAAWTKQWTPGYHFGIPLQTMGVDPNQNKHCIPLVRPQDWRPGTIAKSSDPPGSLHPSHRPEKLIDEDSETWWTSEEQPDPNHEIWFAIWFPPRLINSVRITPRFIKVSNLFRRCFFPNKFSIHFSYSAGIWQPIVDAVEVKPEQDGADKKYHINIRFDREIFTDGLLFTVPKLPLRFSDLASGNEYCCCIGDVSAGYTACKLHDHPAEVGAIAKKYPNATFFFGDEPDLNFVSPDTYARAYVGFAEAVRAGSPTAKVSPGGFADITTTYSSAFLDYAKQFLKYVRESPVNVAIDEWRFHFFHMGPWDVYNILPKLHEAAEWCRSIDSTYVVGSFGSPGREESVDLTDTQREIMKAIREIPEITQAVWWSYDWVGTGNHRLVDTDGKLLPRAVLKRHEAMPRTAPASA